jgi:hypothetical protein
LPCDYRLYDKVGDGKSKNDHFQDMLALAKDRGFHPECVVFDSWYASVDNLKTIREYGWIWLTRLKSNRKVNPDKTGLRAVETVEIGPTGRVVQLEGYGLVRVFKIVITNDDIEYWATNDLRMTDLTRVKYAGFSWAIENYHRGIKQFCGVERCQARAARAQRNHIGFAIRAFLRLEIHCFKKGISWFEAKIGIIREAVRAYLAKPIYTLTTTA